ncbi:hypothetical protein RUESEDTHA_02782 [Ruegeria sp. THAF57]|uniref:DUF6525 family protein n=1 Tax=Ruegeria sp. THAF57 TaxID=2744555 RepID=UPI0015DFF690|nr:DUF6525 family protein [Ruegeria sp. THAF57]CAD0185881.1 hypothetical protein RUESEDTHA_02782 [Ruegeria sp. THAF57]
MPRNLGQTRLRKRRRAENPMREFDRLPPVLRAWVSQAALPWRPRSVLRAYQNALAQTGDQGRALEELGRLEALQLAKDSTGAATA